MAGSEIILQRPVPCMVSDVCLAPSSLTHAQVMARVMGAEAAIVRSQFVSGTHAIATALFSVLRPGDTILAVAGR